ncbi:MAG TPA: hypothetical protein PLB10_17890 [Thiolinea sp.]|nr:hypothetical protein [Thiolinea sp.]
MTFLERLAVEAGKIDEKCPMSGIAKKLLCDLRDADLNALLNSVELAFKGDAYDFLFVLSCAYKWAACSSCNRNRMPAKQAQEKNQQIADKARALIHALEAEPDPKCIDSIFQLSVFRESYSGHVPVSASDVVKLIEQTAIASMVTKTKSTKMPTATEFFREFDRVSGRRLPERAMVALGQLAGFDGAGEDQVKKARRN